MNASHRAAPSPPFVRSVSSSQLTFTAETIAPRFDYSALLIVPPCTFHTGPIPEPPRRRFVSKRNLDAPCRVNRLLSVSDLFWFVAHTRPRCEKKLLQFCEREGLFASLPCYRAVHKCRGKTVVFQKPLFPGYVFSAYFA